MKNLILNIVILVCYLPMHGQAPLQHEELIGKVFKTVNEIPRFKNYQAEEGILINEVITEKIGFLRISDAGNIIVLCTRHVAPKTTKIIAILELGKLQKNTQVIMAQCRLNSKADGYIVAVVKPTAGPYFKNVISAWRVDVKSNRFVAVSPKGIDCINEEYEN